MTRRRWIADEVSGNRAALVGEHADHLIRVLRARVGQEFDIATGSAVYRGYVSSISDQRVDFELGDELPGSSISPITMLMAIIKFDRMEWAIEKCTELGVSRFIPLIASRTDAHLAAAAGKRVERWKRIAREASEQARRASHPQIAAPIKTKEAAALSASRRILLSESEEDIPLARALDSNPRDLILAIGPEGGWTPAEETLFRDSGWIAASLGRTILRAETAAIAATAITFSHLQ